MRWAALPDRSIGIRYPDEGVEISRADMQRAVMCRVVMCSVESNVRKCTGRNDVCGTHVTPKILHVLSRVRARVKLIIIL